jgi:hypothetical protein
MGLANDVLLLANQARHLVEAPVSGAVFATGKFEKIFTERPDFQEIDLRRVTLGLVGVGAGVIGHHVPI